MKKFTWLAIVTVVALLLGCFGTANAMIIRPQGEGQIGISSIVMRNELPVYETASESAKVTQTLTSGRHVIVMKLEDGWAQLALADDVDGTPAGWVKAEYLLIDNGFYMTGGETPVYAWNDTEAPVYEVLEEYTLVPMLKDDGEWIIVSLNGASAFILKTAEDLALSAEE